MYFNPYLSSTVAATSTQQLLDEIHKCLVLGYWNLENNFKKEITPPNPNHVLINAQFDTVKPFSHPLVDPKTKKIYIDVRGCTSIDRASNRLEIRDETEFMFRILRANLIQHSIDYTKESLYAPTAFSLEVFANWLSELIARRWNLDPGIQNKLIAIIGLYYYCLFKGESALTDEYEQQATCLAVARRVRIGDGQTVVSVAKAITELEFPKAQFNKTAGTFGCIEHLCYAIKEITQTVRLHELNAGVLITLVGGSWFGPTAKELSSVALEDPTTWIAMLAYSIKTDTYKKTRIGDTAQRYRREHDSFMGNLARLISH